MNIFGAIEILVPKEYSVELDAKVFLGESKSNAIYSHIPTSHQIRITGLVILGSLEVKLDEK